MTFPFENSEGVGTGGVCKSSAPSQPPPMVSPSLGAGAEWFQHIPPGWTTVMSPQDGRIYYWEEASGRTSWTHPMMAIVATTTTQPVIPEDGTGTGTGIRLPNPFTGMRNTRASSTATTRADFLDTPLNAARRPDNHQCYAATAFILCFPIGICALIHSIAVDRAWSDSRYGDAVNHSRQASQYACFGTFLGIVFWLWFFFAEEIRGMGEWFKFD